MAERGILVPVRFEQARLPMDVRAVHTTDLDDWREDPTSISMQECLRALMAMIAHTQATQSTKAASVFSATPSARDSARFSICVLPFTNMSGEPEQEYFSDGITEDIITDLIKVSALEVVSRNGSFLYKGKQVDVLKVARKLKVSHVLEGSMRRVGGRVRITAQLIDGTSNRNVWAECYDRDASDISALQDEISHAIVKALRLRLLPEEKKAIERRGTDSVEAHNLYLMARQIYMTSQENDARSAQAIIRMCARTTEIDPRYAQAWALMAIVYRSLREVEGGQSGEGIAAADRALTLDPKLAETHAVKAQLLLLGGDAGNAAAEVAIALHLDPEFYEVNRAAGRLNYQLHCYADAIRFYEKAASLMEGDANSAFIAISCYAAAKKSAEAIDAAQKALKRFEAILARDQNNVGVIAYSAYALATLGEGERAKARMSRALLMSPDNFNIRYNFACTLSSQLKDKNAALEMLGSTFERIMEAFLPYAKADPDLEPLRDDPRYQVIVAAAEARLAAAKGTAPVSTDKI